MKGLTVFCSQYSSLFSLLSLVSQGPHYIYITVYSGEELVGFILIKDSNLGIMYREGKGRCDIFILLRISHFFSIFSLLGANDNVFSGEELM